MHANQLKGKLHQEILSELNDLGGAQVQWFIAWILLYEKYKHDQDADH